MRNLDLIAVALERAEENVKALRAERDEAIIQAYAPGAYYRGELTMIDIAELTNLTVGQVSKIIKRGMQQSEE